jgi:parvulin-like peptidyl-prolyl isomerase
MSKSKEINQPPEPKHHRSTGRTVTYVLTVALLVVVVIAFVGTPALTGVASGSRVTFGSYAGKEVVYQPGNYMARQYEGIAQQVQDSGQEITETIYRQVWRSTFDRAVFHLAMLQIADQTGVGVAQQAVDREMSQWPEFLVDGRFSSERYRALSSQSRYVLRDYLTEVLIDQQVRQDLFGDITLSDAELEFLVNLGVDERQFRFVQFGFSEYPEEEVITYAEENLDRFRRANLSVITLGSESDAQSVLEQLESRTQSFEDLARNQSRDLFASDGGDMGWVYYHELELDFEDLSAVDRIFELGEGETSGILRTTFGWNIYRLDEGPIDPDLTDEETVGDIRDYLNIFERGRVEDYLQEKASEFVELARAEDFAEAARAINQQPETTEYFPVNYGNVPYYGTVSASANTTFAEGAYRDDFFEQLFSLSEGEVTDPIVIRDYVFVLQLADERSAEESALDSLRLYMPSVAQQFTAEVVQDVMVRDDLLHDNFNEAYNRLVAGQ